MKYRTRTYYSDSQKALMWERWKEGDSLQQIAQLFDRQHSSVERILSLTGGIRPPERHPCLEALQPVRQRPVKGPPAIATKSYCDYLVRRVRMEDTGRLDRRYQP